MRDGGRIKKVRKGYYGDGKCANLITSSDSRVDLQQHYCNDRGRSCVQETDCEELGRTVATSVEHQDMTDSSLIQIILHYFPN